jgi:hypothetical protein
VSSLAFVVAAVAAARPARTAPQWWYAGLVAAVGVGSLIQHGPHPPWQAYAHDLPLAALLAFVAADAAADLSDRRPPAGWPAACWPPRPAAWAVPALAVAPLVAVGPAASTLGQAGLAVAAVGLSLWRAWRRPGLRRVLVPAGLLLAAGALAGNLSDRAGWCQPDSLLQGHAVWHVLAAAALWRLAAAVGTHGATPPARPGCARPSAVGGGVEPR